MAFVQRGRDDDDDSSWGLNLYEIGSSSLAKMATKLILIMR